MPAMPGAKVWTNTPLVHEARYVSLGTLFLSHVLDLLLQGRRDGIPTCKPSIRLSHL